jgi:hypothetical protein
MIIFMLWKYETLPLHAVEQVTILLDVVSIIIFSYVLVCMICRLFEVPVNNSFNQKMNEIPIDNNDSMKCD